jgi:hypothetical protein
VAGTKTVNVPDLVRVRTYQVTDNTDMSVPALSSFIIVGSPISVMIPAKGSIELILDQMQLSVASGGYAFFGIRIGGVNYFPNIDYGGTLTYPSPVFTSSIIKYRGTAGNYLFTASGTNSAYADTVGRLSIEAMSIPSGTQTLQIVAAKVSAGSCTVQGASGLTTKVGIRIFDHS